MKRLNQTGSHVIAIAALVLALGVVGFVGYKVSQSNSKPTPTATLSTTTQTQTKPAIVPTTIGSTADLQQASSVLDQSSSQLNSSLDDSSMSADLNSML